MQRIIRKGAPLLWLLCLFSCSTVQSLVRPSVPGSLSNNRIRGRFHQKNHQISRHPSSFFAAEVPKDTPSSSSSRGSSYNSNLFLLPKLQASLDLVRPWTLLQAVGALVVGCLAITGANNDSTIVLPPVSSLAAAMLSVYTSYGAGMAVNDCVDAATDARHLYKNQRPIPSGRMALVEAWGVTVVLAVLSVLLATMASYFSSSSTSYHFVLWTLSNLVLMFLYAVGGLQKVFLIKNLIVGWLGISPLIGAVVLCSGRVTTALLSSIIATRLVVLLQLGLAGMGVGVAREILKDLEDVRVDRWAGKRTLPHAIGCKASHRVAYGLAAVSCAACWFCLQSQQCSSSLLLYDSSVILSSALVIRSSWLPLNKGQSLLKKSIYILLAGMITSSILAQQ